MAQVLGRRLGKWLAILLASLTGFALLTLITVVFIDSKVYSNYIKQELIAYARERGVKLVLGECDFFVTWMSCTDVEVLAPRLPLIEADLLTVHFGYSGVLRRRIAVDISAQLYGGHAEVKGELIPSGAFLPRRIAAEKVEISKVRQLELLGFRGGWVDASFPALTGETPATISGRGNIAITTLQKPAQTVLPPFLTGLPLSLTIPPIEQLTVIAHTELTVQALSTTLELTSSLANCSSTSHVGRLEQPVEVFFTPSTISVDSECKLSASGQEFIGPFLPLVSRGLLPSTTNAFSVSFTNSKRPPAVQWRARNDL